MLTNIEIANRAAALASFRAGEASRLLGKEEARVAGLPTKTVLRAIRRAKQGGAWSAANAMWRGLAARAVKGEADLTVGLYSSGSVYYDVPVIMIGRQRAGIPRPLIGEQVFDLLPITTYIDREEGFDA